jgi:tRNA A-37 threonylcarbamoyl transferase component Bud32
VRLKRAGIETPTIFLVDLAMASIYMEEIIGVVLKEYICQNGCMSDEMGHRIGKMIFKIHGNHKFQTLIIYDSARCNTWRFNKLQYHGPKGNN